MRENERRKASTTSQVKRLNALMQTCGFMMSQVSLPIKWDYPAKVELAVVSWLYSKIFVVATWSPKLNKKGNSELGMH
jgi:glutaminase